jgi:soluble lytic murein transglycosylase-like protein
MLMLAASPTTAAERTVSSLLTPDGEARPGGKVSVVRVDRRTGKLVRTVSGGTPPAAEKISAPPAHIQKMVENSARAHDMDPLLVQSVIQVESNYNHYAVSPKGAEGLMQLMPGTARQLGVGNSFDPAQNIEGGVAYLKYLQGVYGDDRLALAAYNAGPKAVDKYKSVPPYQETQDYVEQVGRRYQAAKRNEAEQAAATLVTTPITTAAPNAVDTQEKHPRLEQTLDDHGRLVLRTAQE